jgi:serine/threonine protein kinase
MKDTLPYRVRLRAFEVDLRAGVVRAGERSAYLQEQPFSVLRMLVERSGEIVTRDEIHKKLWPNDTVVDFDQGINAAIRKLRQVLGDSAETPTYIETVARRGYRLLQPVERLGGDDSSDPALLPAADRNIEHPAGAAALIGEKVSHYRVLEVVGGGGMGMVYKAEDLRLGRCVAVKFLPSELANDSVALQRFEREAKTASSLDHPNICPIHEFGEHEGRPFIVMQLLEGETLRDRLAANESQALPVGQVLDIANQVCNGLQAAHEKGIIHRDIKPANIFLTTKGTAKILDFGLAKLEVSEEGTEKPARVERGFGPASSAPVPSVILSDEVASHGKATEESKDPYRRDTLGGIGVPRLAAQTQGRSLGMTHENDALDGAVEAAPLLTVTPRDPTLTRTGAALGTAGYMSPEQVRGEKLDARTDIFSLGAILYEMATGRRAFSADTAAVAQDAIRNQAPVPAHELNPTIPPKLEQIINRATEKDRELRYPSAAEMQADLQSLAAEEFKKSESGQTRKPSRWKWLAAATVVIVAIIGAILVSYFFSPRPPKLTDKDTIVIADFANLTRDAVFDDTLRQALTVQLSQSPFLNILSNRKVRGTLKEMNRSTNEPLTEDAAREVCQRTGSKAMLAGSIGGLGKEYILGLKAKDCNTGNILAEAQEQATSREAVLKALDEAAIAIRKQMGESLSSVQRYATPLAAATTPSLEAWKAFSMGNKTLYKEGPTASLPFFKRAVEIDPNFARAYYSLSVAYGNLNEGQRSEEYERKAYELRDKVSQRERSAIEANHYEHVTGELEKAAQVYELWQQNYPRDPVPYGNLGADYGRLGDLDEYLEESRRALRLEPNYGFVYLNVAAAYMNVNQLDEAEEVFRQAEQHGLSGEALLQDRYLLAFLKGDTTQMKQLAAAAMGKPGTEDLLLASQADTEGWYGKFKNARKLTQRAMDSARHNDAKETAANYQVAAALREVAAGNRQQARADATAALKLSQSLDVKAMATLALAQAGDVAAAEELATFCRKNTISERAPIT